MAKAEGKSKDELRKEEQRLDFLEKQLKKPFTGIFSQSRKKRKEREFRERNDQQTMNCAHWLRENDKEFIKLTDQVYRLLSRKEIHFTVYNNNAISGDEDSGVFKGTMHKNGYIYLNAEDSERLPGLSNTGAYRYPQLIEGRIDYLGRVVLKAKSFSRIHYGYRIMKPDHYAGKIDEHGNITLEAIDLDSSNSEGVLYIGRLVGDLFGHSPLRLAVFLKARAVIIGRISQFRQELSTKEGKNRVNF